MEKIYIGKYPISKMHDNLLLMLIEIERICKNFDIKYSLIFGTALGALRHKDFIPWDDDADIAMDRRNYKKFVKACKEGKLKDNFRLDCSETNKKWGMGFAKFRLLGTYFPENWTKKYLAKNYGWTYLFMINAHVFYESQ